jgi:hypothetical protein
MTRYIVLKVDSDAQAVMLVEDIRENQHEDLRTPHWGNLVHVEVTGVYDQPVGSVIR